MLTVTTRGVVKTKYYEVGLGKGEITSANGGTYPGLPSGHYMEVVR